MSDELKSIADDFDRIAKQEYDARQNALLNGLKNRIDLVRDYTIFGTAIIVATITLYAADYNIEVDESLLILSGLLSLIAVVATFVSRLYYIEDGDVHINNTEHKYAYRTSMAQAVRFAKNKDEAADNQDKIKKTAAKTVHRWIFFVNDTVNIAIILGISGLSLFLALII